MNDYLNNFDAARNNKASAALGEVALMIPRFRADQLSRLFLPTALRLWNLLQSGVFSIGTLSSFNSATKIYHLLDFFLFVLVSFYSSATWYHGSGGHSDL